MAISSISASLPAAPSAKPAAAPAILGTSSIDTTSVESGSTTHLTGSPASDVAKPSRQQVDQAMEKMRGALPSVARNLQFSVDEETGRSVVKIVDSSTDEVIRQMPSEELLMIAKALDKFTGLLLKQKA